MSIITRSTVVALTVESTEGTPVAPTVGTDFIPIQEDFAMSPAFDELENAELKNSLGPAKSILGLENPTASLSLYLKNSSVAGQAPNYGDLLEAAFGAESIAAAEYDTVGGSTTTVVEVDTGEGATFERGEPLLIKDATNGYSLRPVESISGDSLTLGFALANAPGTGVNLGRATLYKPADADHQTLSLWQYIGNSGALQMMAGSRVTNISGTFNAGELINFSYSLEGVSFYFNPVVIGATDIYIDWTDDAGTFAATVTAKTYNNPKELAEALQTAMNGQTTETIAVEYSDSTGKYTISSSTSAVLSLLWNTGTNAANTIGDKIGFSVAADDTGATSYEGDDALSFAAGITPTFDSADPLVAKNNIFLLGDTDDNACFQASSVEFSLDTPKTDILSICAESGKSGSIIGSRSAEITVTALLDQYEVDKFYRFKNNQNTKFMYGFGTKTGGNWDATKCGILYSPTATITSFEITSEEDLATLNMTLQTYVDDSGNGEIYLGFV